MVGKKDAGTERMPFGQKKETSEIKSDFPVDKADKFDMNDMSWIDDIPCCPVFHPTKEEFEDPLAYISTIAPDASKYGICKIVSPLVPSVPGGVVLMKEKTGFKFKTHVQPLRLANWDVDDKINFVMSGRNYSFREYERMANKAFARKFSTAANLPIKFVEEEFWREITSGKTSTVEYGCDIEGSAFSTSPRDPLGTSKWNLKDLSRNPNSMLRLLETSIPGVTDPMLYIGMLFSMFAWHVEDHYLYSLNYHHCGAPKTWYGVPGHAAHDFENIVREHVYDHEMLLDEAEGTLYDLLIGKTTMFPPKILSEYGVPVFKAVQMPGDFVITFPRSYHAGFSHGFNCGEAVNFATVDWFAFGAAACKRYAFLNKPELFPYEKLLCKEMTILAGKKSSSQKGGCSSFSVESRGQLHLKIAFVNLIRFQHQMIWLLKKLGAQTSVSLRDTNPTICFFCKRSCHVAYISCQCNIHQMCLNHAKEIGECNCGSMRTVFVRDNFQEMVFVAQGLEQEGICSEAQINLPVRDHTELDEADMKEILLSDEFLQYEPYCHIDLEHTPLNNSLTGESSSTCEPLSQRKRQSESTICLEIAGDSCKSEIFHIKELSRAPKRGTVVQSLNKFHNKFSSSSKNEKKLNFTGKEKILYKSSLDRRGPGACNKYSLEKPTQGFANSIAKLSSNRHRNCADIDCEADRVKFCRIFTPKDRNLEEAFAKLNGSEKQSDRIYTENTVVSQSKHSMEQENKTCVLHRTPDGQHVLNISDILKEIKVESSPSKILNKWKLKAISKHLNLKAHRVDILMVSSFDKVDTNKQWGLSHKGCIQLKKLLQEDEAHILEQLIGNTFGKLPHVSKTTDQTVKSEKLNGVLSKKRDFDTMNHTPKMEDSKISVRKDSASIVKVHMRRPSEELKVQNSCIDQSHARKFQQFPTGKKVKKVSENHTNKYPSTALEEQQSRSVRRILFKESTQTHGKKERQLEEKKHLNLPLATVKLQRPEHKVSKMLAPLAEENIKDPQLSENVLVKLDVESGSKVSMRKNFLVDDKEKDFQVKTSGIFSVQGAEYTGQKRKQPEYADSFHKDVNIQKEEAEAQICGKPNSRKPNRKLSNIQEVNSANYRENKRVKCSFSEHMNNDAGISFERAANPHINHLKIKDSSPQNVSKVHSAAENKVHPVFTDCSIPALDSSSEGLDCKVVISKSNNREEHLQPQKSGNSVSQSMHDQVASNVDRVNLPSKNLNDIDTHPADFESDAGCTKLSSSTLDIIEKSKAINGKASSKEISVLNLQSDNQSVRIEENLRIAKQNDTSDRKVSNCCSEIGIPSRNRVQQFGKLSNRYTSGMKVGSCISNLGASSRLISMIPECSASADSGHVSGMVNDMHHITKQEFSSKTKMRGGRNVDVERTAIWKPSQKHKSPRATTVSHNTFDNALHSRKRLSSSWKERYQLRQGEGNNSCHSGYEYDRLNPQKHFPQTESEQEISSHVKGGYEVGNSQVQLSAFRNKLRDLVSASSKECQKAEPSIDKNYVSEKQVRDASIASDSHHSLRINVHDNSGSFERDLGEHQLMLPSRNSLFHSAIEQVIDANPKCMQESFALGFENKSSSFCPYSPRASGLYYPKETKAPKPMPADDNECPVQLDSKLYIPQREDYPPSLNGKDQNMNHDHWSDLDESHMSPVSPHVGPYISQSKIESTKSKIEWPSHGSWILNENKDNGIHTSEMVRNSNPNPHQTYLPLEYSSLQYNTVAEEDINGENVRLIGRTKESQGQAEYSKNNVFWADLRSPATDNEAEFSMDVLPHTRSWQCQNSTPAKHDLEHGYWPSFVNTPKKQEQQRTHQQLLIEKWGKA